MRRSSHMSPFAFSVSLVASLLAISSAPSSADTPPHSRDDQRPTSLEIRIEIDRVVDETLATTEQQFSTMAGTALDRIGAYVRCAEFMESARYCLGYGWTTSPEIAVQQEFVAALEDEANSRSTVAEGTGDLSLSAMIERAEDMTPPELAKFERRELEDAAAGIDRFLELEKLRLDPADQSTDEGTAAKSPPSSIGAHAYPESGAILKNRVSEQTRTYWCGPTTIQMMAWNYGNHTKVAQSTWASRLGTTSQGTAITDMVRVVNSNSQLSKWVTKQDARYVTLNINNHTYAQWYRLNVNHYATWRTPVILHPQLLKRYYPYLDDNGSGHFQLGRGWDYQSNKSDSWRLKYYEPWNQQRFNPSERYIPRRQTRWAKNSFLANKAHFLHNIGV